MSFSAIKVKSGPAFETIARAWIRYAPSSFGKRWLWARCWRHYAFRSRTIFGAKITGDTADLIQRYIYFFGVWEPDITAWLRSALKPGDCFVDVGANIGYYTLLASQVVGP